MTQQKGTERSAGSGVAAQDRAAPGPKSTPRLKPQVQEHIGRQLRAVYDDVLKQPLPDRFRELMDKLDKKVGDPE